MHSQTINSDLIVVESLKAKASAEDDLHKEDPEDALDIIAKNIKDSERKPD